MSFSVYNQLTSPSDYVYKLIQLPKGLVEYIKNDPQKSLSFKAPTHVKNQLAICTDTTTYNLRQMNHSNTQLLVNDMAINKFGKALDHPGANKESKKLLAIGSASYIYELTEAEGHIETADVPLYKGPGANLSRVTKTVDEVCNDSPIAPGCFLSRWHALGGSIVQGKAVILAPKLITEVLHTIISLMIAEDIDKFEIKNMAKEVGAHNAHFTRDMVDTVTRKFGTVDDDMVSLDTETVAKWFGIETLRNLKNINSEKELLLEWKASLPPFYNASLELKQLLGNYCRPSAGQIRYLRPDSLSDDLHTRIKEMFQIVKEWDFEEFLPFVSPFVPASKKPDTIILKYARKKRVGKKFIVCPR